MATKSSPFLENATFLKGVIDVYKSGQIDLLKPIDETIGEMVDFDRLNKHLKRSFTLRSGIHISSNYDALNKFHKRLYIAYYYTEEEKEDFIYYMQFIEAIGDDEIECEAFAYLGIRMFSEAEKEKLDSLMREYLPSYQFDSLHKIDHKLKLVRCN